jgi:hypothetical protein
LVYISRRLSDAEKELCNITTVAMESRRITLHNVHLEDKVNLKEGIVRLFIIIK